QTGSLTAELVLLRRHRGGTSLVVVTGSVDMETLPMIAALRRRFDRVIVASLVGRPTIVPVHPGLPVVAGAGSTAIAFAVAGWWRQSVIVSYSLSLVGLLATLFAADGFHAGTI